MSALAMSRLLTLRHSIATLFIAGFISTLIFHQAVAGIWYLMGTVPTPPFNFRPTTPFGVPFIWSFAFWGGVWGIVYGWVENKFPHGAMYWIAAVVFGAIAPTLVDRIIVAPLKGQPIVLDFSLWRGFLINGVWGLGVAAFLRWRP